MVLDAKALTWAAKNDIDTPKLKKAKVPIYGKWYFPEIPPDVVLISLETGEQQVFPERMIAGEVIYVPAAQLVRAGLAPADLKIMEVPPATTVEGTRALRALAPEPLVAMARPPGIEPSPAALELDGEQPLLSEDPAELAGIHMPSPSISPFVFAVGFCLVFLGLITNVVFLIVGLLWMLAGAVAWIRVGLIEARASHGGHAEAEHAP